MHHLIAFGAIVMTALLILLLRGQLPETVASHFNAAGVPDSFMPRDSFVTLMLVFCCGLPALVYGLQVLVARRGGANIPQAVYWFDPSRQAETVRWLRLHAAWGTAGLSAFLAHTFWLTVLAHRQTPVSLPSVQFWESLLIFLAATGVWAYAQQRRFSRVEPA